MMIRLLLLNLIVLSICHNAYSFTSFGTKNFFSSKTILKMAEVEITAKMVSQLRAKTDAPMMVCLNDKIVYSIILLLIRVIPPPPTLHPFPLFIKKYYHRNARKL